MKMGKRRKKKKKPVSRPNPRHARPPERIDVDSQDLYAILERAKTGPLAEEDYEKIQAAIETLIFLTQELEKKRVSVERLKRMLFGATTETTRRLVEKLLDEATKKKTSAAGDEKPEEPMEGHGRNGADAYTGAEKILVPLENMKEGDSCPSCEKGKLYKWTPGVLVRIRGQAPLGAKVYEIEKLRCNLCGEVFAAKTPEGVGEEKYDAESASMIALLKYGSGLPFNRLDRLQGDLGIPLPAATQWEIVEKAAEAAEPAFKEMARQAAQGEVLHNDDTAMKVLGLCAPEAGKPPAGEEPGP